MSVTAVVVGVVALTAGAVAAHDVKVKQNRAIGAMQAAANQEVEAIEEESNNLDEQLKEADKRRRANMRRINPTGSSGIQNDSALQRQANTQATQAGGAPMQPTGRNRLLGA